MIDPKDWNEKEGIDKILISFCLVNFFFNASMSVVTPFYPPLAKEAGLSISMIGSVFSIGPIGCFFFAMVFGSKMQHWGRKRCLVIGVVIIFLDIYI